MADQYEILARLGTGGFGTVYRARMIGPYGFQRDVALKVLDVDKADDEILGRFRDEARLLGRIRHPNIPSVGPPVRLDGGWAVPMDLVPGVDCERILKKAGPLPLSVALECVSIVAQTLHELHNWRDLGEDQELQLIHRDVKPSNIMITTHGAIRLLDFGNARAVFGARESITTDHIGGTVGFIPPERLEGREGPSGDIFALGVVLHAFVTGERPQPGQDEPIAHFEIPDDTPDDVRPILEFAQLMRSIDPRQRPKADEVSAFCRDNMRGGPDLATWAQEVIPSYAPRSDDSRVGTVLAEVEQGFKLPVPIPVLIGGLALAAVILMGSGTIFGAGLFSGTAALTAAATSVDQPEPVDPTPVLPLPTPPQPSESDQVADTDVVEDTDTDTLEDTDTDVPEDTDEPEDTDANDVASVVPVQPRPSPTQPKPTPQPQPDPVPTPKPTPVAKGIVELVGDTGSEAVLMRNGKKYAVGSVTPGTYEVFVTWAGEQVMAGTVSVQAKQTVKLRCKKRFRRCVPAG